MKLPKKLLFSGLTVALLLVMAVAVGGDVADPLISLSYLTGDYTTKITQEIDSALDTADQAILDGIDAQIDGASATQNIASIWTESRLKQGDSLALPTGGNVLILAGDAQMNITTGTVVNVTTGAEVSSGSALLTNNRYMAVEDTVANCVITSKTAVVTYQGPYGFTYSTATDYNAMAQGLKDLNLFNGSFTGYGDGFDLEVSPTRVQALIMFIRVLGEEEQALAWTGTTPFTDIAAGSLNEQYVGYAYENGYTNGYTATTFLPNVDIPANQYVEFLLRAMDYRTAGTSDISTALSAAQDAGMLSAEQVETLGSTTFLRADLVSVSFDALATPLADGSGTLAQRLVSQGIFTTTTYQSVLSQIQ